MKATVGQVATYISSGGRFQILSGFWPSQSLSLPNTGLTLEIAKVGGTIVISWPHTDDQFTIELSSTIGDDSQWKSINFTKTPDGLTNEVHLDNASIAKTQFLRLHRQ